MASRRMRLIGTNAAFVTSALRPAGTPSIRSCAPGAGIGRGKPTKSRDSETGTGMAGVADCCGSIKNTSTGQSGGDPRGARIASWIANPLYDLRTLSRERQAPYWPYFWSNSFKVSHYSVTNDLPCKCSQQFSEDDHTILILDCS